MYIEVEARVRYINDYYARQWDEINKEKLASYAELIIVKGWYKHLGYRTSKGARRTKQFQNIG